MSKSKHNADPARYNDYLHIFCCQGAKDVIQLIVESSRSRLESERV